MWKRKKAARRMLFKSRGWMGMRSVGRVDMEGRGTSTEREERRTTTGEGGRARASMEDREKEGAGLGWAFGTAGAAGVEW